MSDAPVLDVDDLHTLQQAPFANVAEAAFDLEIVDGPDRGARTTIDIGSASRVLVGQSPACDLRLSDRAASRRHASLELTDRGLRLTDLGSTNGTFVGALAISQIYLVGGETVVIGRTKLHVTARRVSAHPSQPSAADRFGRVVGASVEMQRLYPLFRRLAHSTMPAILEGETGTGKEVLAEAIHEAGPRASGPFVVLDCTAVAPSMVESELFGPTGLFEQAQGGTLLIDEIADLAVAIQPKLLRAIERSQIRRPGTDQPIPVDVRILATTRRDLDREIAIGRFRDDLFHRLAALRLELPPLRRRRGDVALLARHFATELGADDATFDARIARQLRKWDEDPWPGNVRELRNAVVRHLELGDLAEPDVGTREPEGDIVARILAERLPFTRAQQRLLDEFRARYVQQAIADHGGNIARAAAASGIGRRYFQRVKARKGRA